MTQILTQIYRNEPADPHVGQSLDEQIQRSNELYDLILGWDIQLHRNVDLTAATESFFAAAKEVETDYQVWITQNTSLFEKVWPEASPARSTPAGIGFLKRFRHANHRVQVTTADATRSAEDIRDGRTIPLKRLVDELHG